MYDRFDIVEAYWCFMAEWHGGQGSKEYAMSGVFDRIHFKARPNLSSETLTDNGREIYEALVENPSKLRDRRN